MKKILVVTGMIAMVAGAVGISDSNVIADNERTDNSVTENRRSRFEQKYDEVIENIEKSKIVAVVENGDEQENIKKVVFKDKNGNFRLCGGECGACGICL